MLLGLARGSGPDAVAGMRREAPPYLRPLLGLRRATTLAACADQGLEPWHDPMNDDDRHPRVRLRARALPALEEAIGPGVAEALARTADQIQEDAAALDAIVAELAPDLAELADGGIALPVDALAANPPAIVHRLDPPRRRGRVRPHPLPRPDPRRRAPGLRLARPGGRRSARH